MADVFLSCARQDADTAHQSGEAFDETIERALREAKSVAVGAHRAAFGR